jgi:hypothetical protein
MHVEHETGEKAKVYVLFGVVDISLVTKRFISTKARSSSQMSSREETESDIVFQRARSNRATRQ